MHIPCAAQNDAQTDIECRRYGDLIAIIGHPVIHMTPADARALAYCLLALAQSIEDPPKC